MLVCPAFLAQAPPVVFAFRECMALCSSEQCVRLAAPSREDAVSFNVGHDVCDYWLFWAYFVVVQVVALWGAVRGLCAVRHLCLQRRSARCLNASVECEAEQCFSTKRGGGKLLDLSTCAGESPARRRWRRALDRVVEEVRAQHTDKRGRVVRAVLHEGPAWTPPRRSSRG